tara:strand:- start:14546 stop:15646 length:1101 start_codon:yes stop_codon:yes gene_type:complete
MDTTDSQIEFDDEGICDHCKNFQNTIKPNWITDEQGQLQLEKITRQIKRASKNKDFDCIIGLSGGIDSSYLTYLAVEKMGLNPLLFHVDAGWNSQIAVNNIECLVDGLGLDLYTEVINWEEMRDLQLAFFKSGVPHVDTPQDHAFFATMYKFATKHKINYILTGANLSTECIRNPIEWMYYQSDSRQLMDIHRKFGTIPLKTFPITSILWHKVWLPYFRNIKVLKPLDFVPYTKKDAVEVLVKRFNWQPYPQKHFESRFTKFYESYFLPTRFGYDVRRVQYSSLIVTGQMNRAEAISLLEETSYDETAISQEIEFVANKLRISIEDFMEFMALPKKTYLDYKNQRQLYKIGSTLMRSLRLEIGGKR